MGPKRMANNMQPDQTAQRIMQSALQIFHSYLNETKQRNIQFLNGNKDEGNVEINVGNKQIYGLVIITFNHRFSVFNVCGPRSILMLSAIIKLISTLGHSKR